MFFYHRFATCLTVLLTISSSAFSQSTTQQQTGTATISGTVKLGDAPSANIPMALMPNQNGRQQARPASGGQPQNQQPNIIQTVTDENGVYRFAAVAAGGFRVMPLTETFVVTGTAPGFGGAGKAVNVTEGQAVSQIDFALARGGVITGKVTDGNDRPIIAERISLTMVNETGQPVPAFGGNRAGLETDDRGVYRAYGLPAGRYLVSAGNDGGNRIGPGQVRRANYQRTYHPSATEEAEAQIVEVTAGNEVEGINIRLSVPMKAYAVTGRAVDAQSGQPVQSVTISVSKMARAGRGGQPAGPANSGTTNEKGEFRITGLLPGTYSASVPAANFSGGTATSSEFYSEPASFEITGDDTTGVEIKVNRGASITGAVFIEGTNDPTVIGSLSQLMIFANSRSGQPQQRQTPGQAQGQQQGGGVTSGRNSFSQVGRDGMFRVSGLAPGIVRLNVNGGGFSGGAFKLIRIERNGTPINGDVEVTSGEQVAGIRIVVGYGSAVIQGRVLVNGGPSPTGWQVRVSARQLNPSAATGGSPSPRVSPDGQFKIENLLPGTYEVRATANRQGGGGRGGRGGQGGVVPTQPQIKAQDDIQSVTVTNTQPASITLNVRLVQQ
ncbi:MAG: carboxypeptidase-like regulatory domain-containing protein [Acidobacteriota bacterium]